MHRNHCEAFNRFGRLSMYSASHECQQHMSPNPYNPRIIRTMCGLGPANTCTNEDKYDTTLLDQNKVHPVIFTFAV